MTSHHLKSCNCYFMPAIDYCGGSEKTHTATNHFMYSFPLMKQANKKSYESLVKLQLSIVDRWKYNTIIVKLCNIVH